MPDQYDRAKLKQTNVRLSRLGNELLDKVVEYHGITKTAVFDMLLREHARDLGLLVAPAPAARLEITDRDSDEKSDTA